MLEQDFLDHRFGSLAKRAAEHGNDGHGNPFDVWTSTPGGRQSAAGTTLRRRPDGRFVNRGNRLLHGREDIFQADLLAQVGSHHDLEDRFVNPAQGDVDPGAAHAVHQQ
ncbi:MAG: hypothetical protein U5J82_01090 [Desulfobacterales bacterium]|nr:hypothetical protein [Desulfobacterales bacterium]